MIAFAFLPSAPAGPVKPIVPTPSLPLIATASLPSLPTILMPSLPLAPSFALITTAPSPGLPSAPFGPTTTESFTLMLSARPNVTLWLSAVFVLLITILPSVLFRSTVFLGFTLDESAPFAVKCQPASAVSLTAFN
ncbi:hypothetical protein ACTG5S_05960 [Pasteurella multocida]